METEHLFFLFQLRKNEMVYTVSQTLATTKVCSYVISHWWKQIAFVFSVLWGAFLVDFQLNFPA